MIVKAVIHVHSSNSYDSYTSQKRIVDRAVKEKIDVLCITDHDTISGAVIAKKYAESVYGDAIKVVVGAEYKSEAGDIIGIGLHKEISTKDPLQIVTAIKEQGGVALLPHPFYHHKNVEYLAAICDAIEVFNGRIDKELNDKAVELAGRYAKPYYVASDAHFLRSCFTCINIYDLKESNDGDIHFIAKNSPIEYLAGYSPKRDLYLSQIVKGIKSYDFKLIYYSLRGYIKNAITSIR